MRFEVNEYPAYGVSIETGHVVLLQSEKEMINFLNPAAMQKKAKPAAKLPLKKKRAAVVVDEDVVMDWNFEHIALNKAEA